MQSILILIGLQSLGMVLLSYGNINCLEVHLYLKTMRSKFMGHLLKMTPTFIKNRTGDLMARATNDLKQSL